MEKIKCSPNVKRKTSCTLASNSTSATNTVSVNHRRFLAVGLFLFVFLHFGNTTVFGIYLCKIVANVMDQNLLEYFRG